MLTADAVVVVSGAAGAGGAVKVETVVESKADGSVIVKVCGWMDGARCTMDGMWGGWIGMGCDGCFMHDL